MKTLPLNFWFLLNTCSEKHEARKRAELVYRPSNIATRDARSFTTSKRRIALGARHVAGKHGAGWLELRANPKLQRRDVAVKSRSIGRDPEWASVEIHEHRRITACRDLPVRGRHLLELIALQQVRAFGAGEAVLAIKDLSGATIGIGHSARIWQCFDLPRALLAIVAIADGAHDRLAGRFKFNATAGACRGPDRYRRSLSPQLSPPSICLPTIAIVSS